jgi:ribose transport system permease protein
MFSTHPEPTPDTIDATGAGPAGSGAQPSTGLPPVARRGNSARLWRIRHSASKYSLLGVWLLMAVFFSAIEPHTFFRLSTAHTVFSSQSALVFLSMALVVTFVVGEFDLSVASVLGLAATLVPVLVVLHGVNIVLAIVITLAACVLIGCVNGTLIVHFNVNPIVVTLGMSTFLLGLALQLSNLNTVTGLSADTAQISNYPIVGLPVSFYTGLVLCLGLAYLLRFTPLGRHMLFVGSSREVAHLAGIRVNRIRFGAYVAAALISGIGGVILVAGLGGFDPSASATYLLPSLSALFLGTSVFQPGRFNPLGSLVAVYFLVTGIVGLEIIGLSGWISDVFYGAALVIAVTLSTVVRGRHHVVIR